ncbi:MAG: serine/threonine protein kinase [Gemmataceae bacterium]|nr:serine/threonine protein kinase [Gemmataceae bacterium]
MTPPKPTAGQFLDALRASRLLSEEEIVAGQAAISERDRAAAPALAAAFVRQGKLTTFQARKLLAGISKGMVVGPYRILAPIGKGGMGKVYLARDSRGGQPVALKVLPPHWAREEERLLVRFRREMQLHDGLDHAHLARAYEAGVAGNVHYIALEYVPGRTLARTVQTGGPLAPAIAARVFSEAADGLSHAHATGLIHRDIKPSNLMITPAGHAKILDLGLALREGEGGDATVIGGKGYVVGTMDYISPEQTRNAQQVDARSDLYSLGATLFYSLTGRPPFPGGTSIEKIRRQRQEAPPRIEEYNLDVPEPLADLIDELLSKDPDKRPDSAATVRDRLKAWAAPATGPDNPGDTKRILAALTTEPAAADSSSDSVEVLSAALRRGKWPLIAAAILAVATLVAVAYSLR